MREGPHDRLSNGGLASGVSKERLQLIVIQQSQEKMDKGTERFHLRGHADGRQAHEKVLILSLDLREMQTKTTVRDH